MMSHDLFKFIWSYTSRARASRVTEVTQGRAYRNNAWPPGWHGCGLRDLLEVFVLDVSDFSTSLSHAATVSWSGLLLTFLHLHRPFACLLLVWTSFLPDRKPSSSLGSLCPWHFWIFRVFESWQPFWLPSVSPGVFFFPTFQSPLCLALSFDLACACHLGILTAPFLLTAQAPGTWHTLVSGQISFPIPSLSYSLQWPALLSSWHTLLSPCCFLHSSILYSLHFSTVFNYLLFITSLLPSPL